MAFSSTKTSNELLGTKIAQTYDLNFASVTEGHLKTGLRRVLFASFNNDVTEASGLLETNKDSAGSGAENGSVRISSVTSSDTGRLFVIGV